MGDKESGVRGMPEDAVDPAPHKTIVVSDGYEASKEGAQRPDRRPPNPHSGEQQAEPDETTRQNVIREAAQTEESENQPEPLQSVGNVGQDTPSRNQVSSPRADARNISAKVVIRGQHLTTIEIVKKRLDTFRDGYCVTARDALQMPSGSAVVSSLRGFFST